MKKVILFDDGLICIYIDRILLKIGTLYKIILMQYLNLFIKLCYVLNMFIIYSWNLKYKQKINPKIQLIFWSNKRTVLNSFIVTSFVVITLLFFSWKITRHNSFLICLQWFILSSVSDMFGKKMNDDDYIYN